MMLCAYLFLSCAVCSGSLSLKGAVDVDVDVARAVGLGHHQSLRGQWVSLRQQQSCTGASCIAQNIEVVVLTCGLLTGIILVLVSFACMREDKEEQILPLCPHLMVTKPKLDFNLALSAFSNHCNVLDVEGDLLCEVSVDVPEHPKSEVLAVARLQGIGETTLATVIIRNVSSGAGQSIALVRAGCEIFGFVEPVDPNVYKVMHRSGVHLLTLRGNFDMIDIEALNPANTPVAMIRQKGRRLFGRIMQHVDAGLVIACFLATQVHRSLRMKTVQQVTDALIVRDDELVPWRDQLMANGDKERAS